MLFSRATFTPILAGCIAGGVTIAGCGNSATVNVAGPSIERCGVSVSGGGAPAPAGGGTGTLTVTTERECGWSARSESAWISLSRADGQGPATVTYSILPNPNGTPRRGTVAFGDPQVELSQEPAACRYELSASSAELGATGGTIAVDVVAPGGCAWAAQLGESWLSVQPLTGAGAGTVNLHVAPNSGMARTGTVILGGATLAVRQAGPSNPPPPPPPPGQQCSYVVAPAQRTTAAGGETFTVNVTAPAGCSWTASSQTGWVTVVSGGEGTGSGVVRLQVPPNPAAARTGAVRIADQTLIVDQSPAASVPTCSDSLAPVSRSVAAHSGEVTVEVRTDVGCAWSAMSHAPWIGVLSGQTGAGPGSVRLAIATNAAAAPRTGTVTVGGIGFSIEQAGATVCAYVIKPTYYNAGRGPDEVRIEVRASGECAWTAASGVNWASIAEGRSGKGDGTVRLRVDANEGAPRSATLNIAGQPFTLSQEGDCETTVKPSYYNAGPGPDDIKIQVKTRDGCSWASSSPVAWARITEGTAKTGDGQVRVHVDSNSGAARTAILVVAGERFMLTQEAPKR